MQTRALLFMALLLVGCSDSSTSNDQGCPVADSPDFQYIGKACGDPSATLCEVSTSGGATAKYISCCNSTWVDRGLVGGDAGQPNACP